MGEGDLSIADVERFLRGRYELVSDVGLLRGGGWSKAFSFRSAERPLVVRFGHHVGDFEKDRMAAAWTRPLLPIPSVVEIGDAFDGVFAISARVEGDKLDELPLDRIGAAVDSLIDGLVELHEVELPGSGYGGWVAPSGNAPHERWRDFLTAVPDRRDPRLGGWRERLAVDRAAQDVFDRAQRTLEGLVHVCRDQREVIHGDLLAGNVLASPDGRIRAVFDWGNSLAGDPSYDLASLMFWAPWHPGIDPRRIREAAVARFGDDLDERLICYQLHIALDGIQYQAWAGLVDDLGATTEHTQRLLAEL